MLSLLLSPWAMGKTEEYQRQLESRDDVAAISPGVFKESRNGGACLFCRETGGESDHGLQYFYLLRRTWGNRYNSGASRGYQETAPNGDRFLVLQNGRRYIGPPGSAEYRIVEFEKYSVRIEASEVKETLRFDQLPLRRRELIAENSAAARAELVWRAGLPISAHAA